MTIGFNILAVLALIIAGMVFIIIYLWKRGQRLQDEAEEAENRALAAEKREELLRKNVESVLDYEKQDKAVQKKVDQHVDVLTKTRSKANAEKEIKSLMADLHSIYNSR